jgi:pyrroline-5-carboxylate reductase
MNNQVTIIGAGNLSISLLTAIHRKKFSYKINVIDTDKKKRVRLKKFNVNFFASYTDILNESDLIILMVKPNKYIKVITEMNPYLSKKVIIVSFMAGIEISLIKNKLSHDVPVVRCMTNVTISDSKSHVFYHMKPISDKIVKRLDKFFNSFSKLKKCTNEEDINKITALYGSGPAYYVYFNQIIKDVFIKMGYSNSDATIFTNDLMHGTSKIIEKDKDSDNIISSIASKGGTTQAALSELENNKINNIILNAIKKAYKKSKNILKK